MYLNSGDWVENLTALEYNEGKWEIYRHDPLAAFMIHGADPFVAKEMALHYLLVYVVLLMLGPGKYSLDAMISRKI